MGGLRLECMSRLDFHYRLVWDRRLEMDEPAIMNARCFHDRLEAEFQQLRTKKISRASAALPRSCRMYRQRTVTKWCSKDTYLCMRIKPEHRLQEDRIAAEDGVVITIRHEEHLCHLLEQGGGSSHDGLA